MKRKFLVALSAALLGFVTTPAIYAQATATGARITTPKEHLGFNLGDDYCLANYQQLMSYWAKLEKESDRIKVVKIGLTEENRPHLMAVVTSPANHKKLDYYKGIARKMALAEGLTQGEAAKLAEEGKTVIWLDGGLHASEVLCAQVLMQSVYEYLVANDPESLRILDDVIILFVQANPDGMDLVADHYMNSAKEPSERKMGGLPRLYQKYIGHDNNRDFYANTQAETKNMNRVMYREWFPQIVYNHHQTGPAGAVVFIPPCRDPNNYNIHPMVLNGIDLISANMIQRYLAEGKRGATIRTGAQYSTWFNGGLSTTCQLHNIIGLFTETIGGPNPSNVAFVPNKLLPNQDYLAPIAPQPWHFRDSLGYSVSGNKSILDYSSRHRQQLLYNIYRMGKDAIDAGSKDSWTITPKVVEAAKAGGGGFGKGGGNVKEFERLFHNSAKRDPRGYIIPSDQTDFLTATKFINTLLGNGVKVHRATADFTVGDKKYPKGSYVVKSAQAFRPHVLDMFEPQDHPNDIPYPGAGPKAPYDAAGWTLAYVMGVHFDRILEGFDAPVEEIMDLEAAPPAGTVHTVVGTVGYYLGTEQNDAFRAVNQLLKAGEEVRRLQEPFAVKGNTHPAGTFFITAKATTLPLLKKIAAEVGTDFHGTANPPGKEAVVVNPVRVGLLDNKNGGSMPSGWTRWLLERFDFPFKVVYANDLNSGGLNEKFDVLLFIEGGIGGGGGKGGGKGGGGKGGGGADENTVKNLKKFLEDGGTVLTVGGATGIGKQLGLPVASHTAGLAREKFYIPTSVLRVRVNPKLPLTWGMEEYTDVVFSSSPTFKLPEDAAISGMEKVAWFDSTTPLRSGWAMGQEHLAGGIAMIDAKVGKGRLAMFGPSVLYRGQPHASFKLIFNGIVQAGVKPGT
jgi:hypothetical protein